MCPTISIIIPIYNTEKYIAEALKSLMEQDICNIEIICIDDGSTDNSVQVIKKFQQEYSFILLYEQTNSGPAVARNFGIKKASGKYLMFMDSDDILPPNSLSLLYKSISSNKSQIAMGMIESFNRKKKWIHASMYFFKNVKEKMTNLEKLPKLINNMSPCNKIYDRLFIVNQHLEFLESVHLREDIYFVSNAIYKADSISLIPETVYLYRARDEEGASLTSKIDEGVFHDIITVSNLLDDDQTRSIYKYNQKVWRYRYINELNALAYRLFPYIQKNNCIDKVLKKLHNYLQKIDDKILYYLPLDVRIVLFKIKINKLNIATELIRLEEKKSLTITTKIKWKITKKLKDIFWYLLNKTSHFITMLSSPPKDLWLIGEQQGNGSRDTGYQFFLYCRENYPSRAIYFVTKKNNITLKVKTEKQHILVHGSLKNYLYALHAEVYIFADGYKDIFPYWQRIQHIANVKVGGFLQHGIFGLKKTLYYHSNNIKQRKEHFDLFITSSNKEKTYIIEGFKYPKNIVAVTGLSRFDRLHKNRHHLTDKKILFIPTWRQNLKSINDEHYLSSTYHKKILTLTNSKRLRTLLEKYGYTLNICFHHALTRFTKQYNTSSTIVFNDMQTIDMYDELISSCMLITDYSSVAFDMAYINRPVVFYQFDIREFFMVTGAESFIDFDTELFGVKSADHDVVIDEIEYNIKNNFIVKDVYQKKSDLFFAYKDDHNCKRIFNALEKEIEKKKLKKRN